MLERRLPKEAHVQLEVASEDDWPGMTVTDVVKRLFLLQAARSVSPLLVPPHVRCDVPQHASYPLVGVVCVCVCVCV